MNTRQPRRRMLISYAVVYLIFAAAAARSIFELQRTADQLYALGGLAFYLLLLVVEPWLVSRSLVYLHLVNLLQTGLAFSLLVWVGDLDYFALLFIPPCAYSILNFQRKTAFAWIGGVWLLMVVTLLLKFPLSESFGYVMSYSAGIFLVTGFSYLAQQAEEAQNRSELLLADLQKANRRLQVYAAQVQELAAAGERNRLARELHDSVTQTIFGLTLSAQAARILIDRDPRRAAAELEHMQELAQNALAEMRALIQQLHPRTIAEEGLAAGLRRLAAEHQSKNGLNIDLQIFGERRLPVEVEEELYRVAQEALNNIVKHAQTEDAVITLHLGDTDRVVMLVEDEGAGFDPVRVQTLPGHLGITSMSERVQALGGKLFIESQPGKGTRVRVDLALAQEVEHVA